MFRKNLRFLFCINSARLRNFLFIRSHYYLLGRSKFIGHGESSSSKFIRRLRERELPYSDGLSERKNGGKPRYLCDHFYWTSLERRWYHKLEVARFVFCLLIMMFFWTKVNDAWRQYHKLRRISVESSFSFVEYNILRLGDLVKILSLTLTSAGSVFILLNTDNVRDICWTRWHFCFWIPSVRSLFLIQDVKNVSIFWKRWKEKMKWTKNLSTNYVPFYCPRFGNGWTKLYQSCIGGRFVGSELWSHNSQDSVLFSMHINKRS